MRGVKKQSLAEKITSTIIIIILLTFSLAPIVWMVSTSFKTTQEQTAIPPTLIPKNPTISPYIEGWQAKPFNKIFLNTLIVSMITTVLCVVLASLAGYGFSRFHFRGSNFILMLLFVSQMFPTSAIIMPYFMLILKLGLLNTRISLILSYTSFSLPLCVWMLKSFVDSVPKELDEAAHLDGASPFQTYRLVILPLTRPGLISATIFTFLNAWKEYLFALTLANRPEKWMLSVAITSFIGEHATSWNQMMAVSLISITPIILIYLFLQKYLVSGMISGAIKS